MTITTINDAVTTAASSYDAKGNILTKTGVGSYTYGVVGVSCTAGSIAGPHAVTAIAGGTIGTKTAAYCYDANGNMTSGDGRTITYTAFDKPAAIHRGTTSVRFAYGPDRVRFKREDISSTGTTTTHYIAGRAFERIIAPGGAQTDKHYVGDFAVVTHAGVGDAAVVTTDYLHRDHLGSVEAISDTAGTLVTQLSFDSWGRRRQANWQPMTDAAIYAFDTTLTTRGYTGHEMLDGVGLVHMNGRVYDPTIGRFLSADPHVQAPGNLQNWNRYSYVMNNPLSYTDPTGFFFKKLFKKIGRAFKKAFKAVGRAFKKVLRSPIFRAIIQIVGCALTAATAGIGCAAISAGLALAAGGSIADALQAAAFAFAQVHIWDHVGTVLDAYKALHAIGDIGFAAIKGVVHGTIGGALSVAQGGNFLQGFAANAIGASVGVIADGFAGGNIAFHTALVAAAGCAAASVSGGKCANGAVTAAFANIYNRWDLLGRAAAYSSKYASFTYRALMRSKTWRLLANKIGLRADWALDMGTKWTYLFGNSVGRNAARSQQLLQVFAKLGIRNNLAGRAYLRSHFTSVIRQGNGNIINRFSTRYGRFEVRESLIISHHYASAARLHTTFQVTSHGTRRLITTIPKQFR